MIGRKTRVLVVENNKDLCEVIEAMLKEEDDIELAGTAYDGIQALEMIPKTQPDVILLDIIMPYLDGLEVLARLDETGVEERPKIVMLSAFEEEEMVGDVLVSERITIFLNLLIGTTLSTGYGR